jgi:putative spermidine/putrescine transport system ATP-binding protein
MLMPANNSHHLAPLGRGNHALCVHLEGVTKRFGDVTAIDDIWLDINAGEFMTLLGPSGCGKTTLLNLIAGHIEADAGAIFIDGMPMTYVPPHERGIGMVFQNYALFPHMTVAKNVGYGLLMRGVPKVEVAERVRAVLQMVELEGLEERKPRQLSGGQQQRVALARALVINPCVLLLDEPFSALDKNLRGTMQIELKQLQQRLGITAIFVTHDQSEALCLSDRIAVLAEGGIRQTGTPEDVYRRPADRFVASFIGDVSILRGTVWDTDDEQLSVSLGEAQLTGSRAGFPEAVPGTAADVFIRPEDLRLAEDGDAIAIRGVVSARIFQGGYADIAVTTPNAPSERVIMRRPVGEQAAELSPGTPVAITVIAAEVAIFPPVNVS